MNRKHFTKRNHIPTEKQLKIALATMSKINRSELYAFIKDLDLELIDISSSMRNKPAHSVFQREQAA